MAKDIEIGGRLHSTATGNVVTGANEILDDELNKKQSQINSETLQHVESIDAALQELSPDQTQALALATDVNTLKAKSVRGDETQSLTDAEKEQAISNMGVTGVYDISSEHPVSGHPKKYSTLPAALADVPVGRRKSGMSVKALMQLTQEMYHVEVTEGVTDLPTGYNEYELSEASPMTTGDYTYSELDTENFSAIPSTVGASVLYYIYDSQSSSYTTWLLTKSSDSTYAYKQYLYMQEYANTTAGNTAFLTTSNWQGVDDKPTAGSKNLVKSGGVKEELALGAVYDVSAHNNGATFASLQTLLSNANLNTLIPTSVRKGGMTIKFVQSSDNKYVQYRLMLSTFTASQFIDTANWQGVDDKPTAGSQNLVTSGGILNSDCTFSKYGIIGIFNFNDFVNGGLSNGTLTNQKYRVSSNSVKYADRFIHLHIKEGFRLAVHNFSDQTTFNKDLGWKTGEYVLAPGFYKLLISRITEDISEIANIFEFVSAVITKSETLVELDIQNGNLPLYYELGNATVNNGSVAYSYSLKRVRFSEGYYLTLTAGCKIYFNNDGSSYFYLLVNSGSGWSTINPTSDVVVIDTTCKVIIVVVGSDTQTDASYLSGLIKIIPPFGVKKCQDDIKLLENEVDAIDTEVSEIKNKGIETISVISSLEAYKISPSSSRYGFKFPVLCDNKQSVSVNTGFKVSCVFTDNNNSNIYDTGWLDSIDEFTPYNAVECTIMFRTEPSGSSDWNTIIGGIASIELNVLKNPALFTIKEALINGIVLPNFVVRTSFKNICHQGFSETDYTGRNIAKNYIAAANNGFNYGETDIYFSSDNVPMCCHDSSFDDSVSGVTVNIAEHTAAELKEYNYYGDHISTLDEVVVACKSVGIGLILDHIGYINYDFENRFNAVFSIIKKYKFEDKVEWYVNDESIWDSFTEEILDWYPNSKICISGTMTAEGVGRAITKANSLVTQNNSISLNIDYSKFSVAEIQGFNARLKPGVGIELWTINTINNYKTYMPYVTGITSNKINSVLISGN